MAGTVCIIPARGGSKRMPEKNILPLNGIPLIAYTIRAAIGSGVFKDVFVSTENATIAAIAIREGAQVDDRPVELANDTATAAQVTTEFLQRRNADGRYDSVAMLLPTCPFRTQQHITEAFEMFSAEAGNTTLVGVTEYDFPVQFALKEISGNRMQKNFADAYKATRSQEHETLYHPNGAIYLATVQTFMEQGSFFTGEFLAYKMNAIDSFDIDYPWQFRMAEFIAANREIFR